MSATIGSVFRSVRMAAIAIYADLLGVLKINSSHTIYYATLHRWWDDVRPRDERPMIRGLVLSRMIRKV